MGLIYFSWSVVRLQLLAYPLAMLVNLSAGMAVVPSLTEHAVSLTPDPKNTVDAPSFEYAFTLTNDTSVDMLEFYASPQTATDWEKDILEGKAVQANGDWTVITLADDRGCIYDFLAVFADGDKLEKYGINVCELETHTYYEN